MFNKEVPRLDVSTSLKSLLALLTDAEMLSYKNVSCFLRDSKSPALTGGSEVNLFLGFTVGDGRLDYVLQSW